MLTSQQAFFILSLNLDQIDNKIVYCIIYSSSGYLSHTLWQSARGRYFQDLSEGIIFVRLEEWVSFCLPALRVEVATTGH